MFSFNNPFGACPKCSGLGYFRKIDPDLVITDYSKSLAEGAINPTGWDLSNSDTYNSIFLRALAKHYGFDINTPVRKLPKNILRKILYGTGKEKIKVTFDKGSRSGSFLSEFEGVITTMERRYNGTISDGMKEFYEEYMSDISCPECNGDRLKKESLAVTVGGKNIAELTKMPIKDCIEFFSTLELTSMETLIAQQILKEIKARLKFLVDVGLDYLTLSRSAGTLSGGEAQRIRLATQIGSGLTGVLYILDEPSIGLHQRDNSRLLTTLKHLRDLGNTVIVVEHDEETITTADYIIDMGPGAGIHGGYVVAQGTLGDILKNNESITGQYLSGKKAIVAPGERRIPNGKDLVVLGASENNLKRINVTFPLGLFICVTGVSGSGKSSLVNQILYKELASKLNRAKTKPGATR